MRKIPAFTLCALTLLLSGCGAESNHEDYPIQQDSDLALTTLNHPHGFGRRECFVCHIPTNIHRVNKINSPSFQYAAPLVEKSGLDSCRGCHGSNGVTQ